VPRCNKVTDLSAADDTVVPMATVGPVAAFMYLPPPEDLYGIPNKQQQQPTSYQLELEKQQTTPTAAQDALSLPGCIYDAGCIDDAVINEGGK
jgi:hypothetical protein